MSTAIVEVQSAVAEFDKVAAGLSALQKQYGGVVYDVKTTKGMDEAKTARAAIREPRYEIERVRKAAKEPILKLGKELDGRAKEITSAILAIEEPIDAQIKNEEARKEAEKQAKIDAEMKRVADLQERVAYLRGNQTLTASMDPDLIAGHIEDLEKEPVDASFQEFEQQARDAKIAGFTRLRELHIKALAHQAEQKRIADEREELARLRAEQAKRVAEEKAIRDAEAAKQAAELKAAREKQEAEAAAERKRIAEEEAAAKAARDAEAKKLADERAAFEKQQAEARRIQQAEEMKRAEQARIAALVKPADAEIISVLANHYRAPPEKVVAWILAMDLSEVAAA